MQEQNLIQRLIQGDAVSVMDSLEPASIDCIITDIAYESLEKHRSKGTTTRLSHSKSSSNDWFSIFPNERLVELLTSFYRVLKPHTHLYMFTDTDTHILLRQAAQEAGFWFWNDIIWVKTSKTSYKAQDAPEHQFANGHRIKSGMGYHYRKCKETILMFGKGHKPGARDKRKLNDLSMRDVMPAPMVSGGYPTEKPRILYENLILNSTQPGETVLDPFAGSGVAAKAASLHGRGFVVSDLSTSSCQGIEGALNQEYGVEVLTETSDKIHW